MIDLGEEERAIRKDERARVFQAVAELVMKDSSALGQLSLREARRFMDDLHRLEGELNKKDKHDND